MSAIECHDVATVVFDHVAGRLSNERSAEVAEHLESCAACQKLVAEERAVSELLATRLPRYGAPESLKRRLAGSLRPPPRVPANRFAALGMWLAAAAAVAGVVFLSVGPHLRDVDGGPERTLVTEAVNDHLRVLYAAHPIEIESGGIHQVKPWFSGRLDFAPSIAFDGDAEFALEGGSVGYFVDRKAAVFIYKLRLHTVSLFVFPAEGLPWSDGTVSIGHHRATVSELRGFHIVLLRDGDLGYAIVSDAAQADLVKLMGKIDGAT